MFAICSACKRMPDKSAFAKPFSSETDSGMERCDHCGGQIAVVRRFSDPLGSWALQGFLSQLRSLEDVAELQTGLEELESSPQGVTPQDIADLLTGIGPAFAIYTDLILHIPVAATRDFFDMLQQTVTLIQSENFLQAEAQTTPNKNEIATDAIIDRVGDIFLRKVLALEGGSKQPITKQSKRRGVSGSMRNKPCPCGSGKKMKKCHPRGFTP